MKKIIGILLALYASFAFSATTVPVQLLNPTGSSSGQTIVSTGASSAPGWAAVTVPISTGVTGLGSGVAAGLAAAATGTGGSVLATSPTIATPNITGVTNASTGAAGSIGELQIANGSSVSLTTSATPTNCTSKVLTAGDWIVFGYVQFFQGTGAFQPTTIISSISTTSNTLGSSAGSLSATFGTNSGETLPAATVFLTVSTSTTVYLVGQATFANGPHNMNCNLTAVRFH